MFNLGFCLGSHGNRQDIEAGSLLNNKTKKSVEPVNGWISQRQFKKIGKYRPFCTIQQYILISSISDLRLFTQIIKMIASPVRHSASIMQRHTPISYQSSLHKSVGPFFPPYAGLLQPLTTSVIQNLARTCTLALGCAWFHSLSKVVQSIGTACLRLRDSDRAIQRIPT